MKTVNKLLSLFGLRLSRTKQIDNKEMEFRRKYRDYFEQVKNNKRGFKVYEEYRYDIGDHPMQQIHFESEFSAYHLHKSNAAKVLDIGSSRVFVLGLLAHYDVTTLDIRDRKTILDNETVVTCDAKSLDFPDNSFDAALFLQSLPHFGLGRYGDEFDLDGDIKAFSEITRVIKPDGTLIFSLAMTGGEASIAFNARRNYNYESIQKLCEGLDCVEEKFFNRRDLRFCTLEELTTDPTSFDYYLGCWKNRKTNT